MQGRKEQKCRQTCGKAVDAVQSRFYSSIIALFSFSLSF